MAGIAAITMVSAVVAIHKDGPSLEQDRRVDWIGAALATVALVLLTFALAQSSSAKDGWRTPCEFISISVRQSYLLGYRHSGHSCSLDPAVGMFRRLGTLC